MPRKAFFCLCFNVKYQLQKCIVRWDLLRESNELTSKHKHTEIVETIFVFTNFMVGGTKKFQRKQKGHILAEDFALMNSISGCIQLTFLCGRDAGARRLHTSNCVDQLRNKTWYLHVNYLKFHLMEVISHATTTNRWVHQARWLATHKR